MTSQISTGRGMVIRRNVELLANKWRVTANFASTRLTCYAIHGPTTPQGSGIGAAFMSYDSLSNGYHTYAIEWKKNSITFIVDGRVTGTYSSADTGSRGWVYNQKFFLILNLAMGGTYAGEYIDPTLNQAQLSVDYIRYYSINGVGKVIKG